MGRTCTACLDKAWLCLCITPYHGITCVTVPTNIIIFNRHSWKTAVSGHAWLVQNGVRLTFFGILPSSASSPLCMDNSNSSLGTNYLVLLLTKISFDLARAKACRQNCEVSIQYGTHIYTPFANASLQHIICQDKKIWFKACQPQHMYNLRCAAGRHAVSYWSHLIVFYQL